MPGPSEARTRKELIDPALTKAGWNVADRTQVGLEIPVDGFDPAAWQALKRKLSAIAGQPVTYEIPMPAGVSDYTLHRANGGSSRWWRPSGRAAIRAWPRPKVHAVFDRNRSLLCPLLSEAQRESIAG